MSDPENDARCPDWCSDPDPTRHGHASTTWDAPCARCEHSKSRHGSLGCLVETGNSGSGSVSDAVFCRCDTYVFPPEGSAP